MRHYKNREWKENEDDCDDKDLRQERTTYSYTKERNVIFPSTVHTHAYNFLNSFITPFTQVYDSPVTTEP